MNGQCGARNVREGGEGEERERERELVLSKKKRRRKACFRKKVGEVTWIYGEAQGSKKASLRQTLSAKIIVTFLFDRCSNPKRPESGSRTG